MLKREDGHSDEKQNTYYATHGTYHVKSNHKNPDTAGSGKAVAASQLLLCTTVYMLGRVKSGESILYNHLVCLCVRDVDRLRFDCLVLLTASMTQSSPGTLLHMRLRRKFRALMKSLMATTGEGVASTVGGAGEEELLAHYRGKLTGTGCVEYWKLMLPPMSVAFCGDRALWRAVNPALKAALDTSYPDRSETSKEKGSEGVPSQPEAETGTSTKTDDVHISPSSSSSSSLRLRRTRRPRRSTI